MIVEKYAPDEALLDERGRRIWAATWNGNVIFANGPRRLSAFPAIPRRLGSTISPPLWYVAATDKLYRSGGHMQWNIGVIHASGSTHGPLSQENFLADQPILPIHNMEQRHSGLTKAVADSYSEAAGVCLDRHHKSPSTFDLERHGARSAASVEWQSPDAHTQNAWANETDATEAGAYA